MRIALVSDWYAPRIGGLERQVHDLAHVLAEAGHEAHVITTTPGPHGSARGVIVHRLPGARLPALRVVGSARGVRALERLLAHGGFDVVHAHSALSPLSLLALRSARRLGIASVLTEHSVLRGAGATALSALDRVLGWSAWPDVLAGVSRYVCDELRLLSRRGDVIVLPNGVAPAWWQRPSHVRDDGALRIVSTLRLTRRKRPVALVGLLAQVARTLPASAPLKLCLIGDGPEADRVRSEARRLGVADRLEMPGWQPREHVRAWLARSTVFVLPTSKEALSIATLEALSAGLPVVALDQGGVGDIVEHGREGFLVSDDGALTHAVVRLLEDPPLRTRMIQAGARAVQRFEWQRVLAAHEAAYAAAQQISTNPRSPGHDQPFTALSEAWSMRSPLWGRSTCKGPTLSRSRGG